jgi:AcrR family transcriptional regulator
MQVRGKRDSQRVSGSSRPSAEGAAAAASERDRRLLLAAGEAVITEKGFARSTIEEVAQRAKLTPEIFHQHFQGMGALLRALSGMFVEQMLTVQEQSTHAGIWKGAPARDVVEVAVRSILDVVIDRKGLVRAILAHGTTDTSLAADLRKIGTHLSQRLITVMGECTNAPARPTRAIAFSLLVSVALAHHYILVGDEWSGVSFTKEQLAEETSRLVCAYLGLQPTISIREDTPDAARTEMIEALQSSEFEVVDQGGRPRRPRQ